MAYIVTLADGSPVSNERWRAAEVTVCGALILRDHEGPAVAGQLPKLTGPYAIWAHGQWSRCEWEGPHAAAS